MYNSHGLKSREITVIYVLIKFRFSLDCPLADEHDLRYNGLRLLDLYVVIDELADLMVSIKKETLPLLQRLAQVGRAARVHVIACTQNVLAVTIPTVLKCNFSTTLGLRTANKQQSRFLIAEGGCEILPDPKREGKGYGFIRDGADLAKVQIPYYSDAQINAMISYWTSTACIAM